MHRLAINFIILPSNLNYIRDTRNKANMCEAFKSCKLQCLFREGFTQFPSAFFSSIHLLILKQTWWLLPFHTSIFFSFLPVYISDIKTHWIISFQWDKDKRKQIFSSSRIVDLYHSGYYFGNWKFMMKKFIILTEEKEMERKNIIEKIPSRCNVKKKKSLKKKND